MTEETDKRIMEHEAVASTVGFSVGDFVNYKRGRGFLRSGCGHYDRAVVVSLVPFVLVSEWGDMMWRATVASRDFEKIGDADVNSLRAVIDRLRREFIPENTEAQPPAHD